MVSLLLFSRATDWEPKGFRKDRWNVWSSSFNSYSYSITHSSFASSSSSHLEDNKSVQLVSSKVSESLERIVRIAHLIVAHNFVWLLHQDLNLTPAILIRLQNTIGLRRKAHAELEKRRPYERLPLKVIERDGLSEQLPLRFIGQKLEDEFLRIGQEIMLVVLIPERKWDDTLIFSHCM